MVTNSKISDLDLIFSFYQAASAYQESKGEVVWPEFDRGMVIEEIRENRQWKLVLEDQVACIWAHTYSDPEIWGDKNNNPAIYIHRIASNPDVRGKNTVNRIVNWAKGYASEKRKQFIRMDTVGHNKKLIEHYTKNGFDFLGLIKLTDYAALPTHYHDAEVSLFEMKV